MFTFVAILTRSPFQFTPYERRMQKGNYAEEKIVGDYLLFVIHPRTE